VTERERYAAGDQIADKYVLLRELDSGGMGLVWVAENVDLEVQVALKLLRVELSETNAADRMLNEARMLARLQHPAIVRVHDCGRTKENDPFLAMELLDGESLADFLTRQSRISAIEAVTLLLPIVDAVRVAHQAGIIHRDLKPENIFLAKVAGRVQPKVLDFGIALAEFVGTRRTTHGAVLGSPAYMAPEQARGQDVTLATDQWALCMVLYELVTGTLPFEGLNYHATLRAIVEDTAPAITQLSAGDELLAAILERGLAKDPSARYPSVQRLGAALAEWLLSHGVTEDVCNVSLRARWLASTSDPPSSLEPVTLPRPSLPSFAQRETLESPATGVQLPKLNLATADVKRSTEGVAITSERPPRSARSAWILLALVTTAAVGFAAMVLLRSNAERPPVASSATVSVSAQPAHPVVSSVPAVAQQLPDAGPVRALEPPPVPRTRRAADEPRPRAPTPEPGRPFRPLGI
jgi:serine/threonine protein kinase